MNQVAAISLFLVGALVSALAQVLLKRGALLGYSRIRRYINIYVISGYFMMLSVTMINVWAYRGVEFKVGPVVGGMSYFFIIFLSWAIFNEKLTYKRISGAALIVAGILLFIWK
jgi:small multidrug resistance pump